MKMCDECGGDGVLEEQTGVADFREVGCDVCEGSGEVEGDDDLSDAHAEIDADREMGTLHPADAALYPRD